MILHSLTESFMYEAPSKPQGHYIYSACDLVFPFLLCHEMHHKTHSDLTKQDNNPDSLTLCIYLPELHLKIDIIVFL